MEQIKYRVVVLDMKGKEIANGLMNLYSAYDVPKPLIAGASAIRLDGDDFGGPADRWIPVHNIKEINIQRDA